MNPSTLAWAALLSLTPISELRGGIPFAVARGADILPAALWCVAWNALAAPLALLFLGTVHKLLYRWGRYASFFDRFIERARAKVHPKVERFGYWGLLVFVAIPLPVTGAWTGALGAWVLGMERKRAVLAIAAGVLVAGIIVSLVVGLGIEAFSFFIKRV